MGRKPDLVSVVIPCYNHGEFVHGAIECILDQTYQNFEIIVVDDGSDDEKTKQILKKITTRGVKVYFKENGDVASARNHGIERSIGQYILTLDADDRFHPAFVEKGIKVLEQNPEIGMVTSYITRIYGDRKTKVEKYGGDLSTFIRNHESSASLLFRYQCWEDAGGYDEDIYGFEDWDFAIGVTKRGWKVYSIPEYLFYYRDIEEGSLYERIIHKRPEIMQYLVKKHKAEYQKYIEESIYEREKLIKEYKDMADLYKNSSAFKLGSFLLKPISWLKNLSSV